MRGRLSGRVSGRVRVRGRLSRRLSWRVGGSSNGHAACAHLLVLLQLSMDPLLRPPEIALSR